jgi:hypothetical protein
MIATSSLERAAEVQERVSFQQLEAEATEDCIAAGRGLGMVER